ncbi:MAG: ankyrin repeat protein [Alteromonas naphthalenivorans]|jgi:ankyrin repeat protein
MFKLLLLSLLISQTIFCASEPQNSSRIIDTALANDCIERIQPLLDKKTLDPNKPFPNNMTPLSYAAAYGSPKIIAALLAANANVDTTAIHIFPFYSLFKGISMTPLALAIMHKKSGMLSIHNSAGGDTDSEDETEFNNCNATNIAIQHLKRAGADKNHPSVLKVMRLKVPEYS